MSPGSRRRTGGAPTNHSTGAGDVLSVRPQLYIGGSWGAAADGATFDVHDPATGHVLATVADADVTDGLLALEAASGAQLSWAKTSPRDRSDILRRTFEELSLRAEDLARVITLEMGKPLREAHAEVTYAAEFFRWYAEEAVRITGRYSMAPRGGYRLLTTPRPVGPCVMITPWNFPLAMGARKIAPALAAGCTTIVKPAAETPLAMLMLAGILTECGAPPGVVNVVTTTRSAEVVDALLVDSRIRKLSFTGSTEVGRHLLSRAAPNVLRTSMELGGNAPFIVCADADVDAAVQGALLAKMRNMGQSCVAANRFYVHESAHDRFIEGFTAGMTALSVGHGLDAGTDVGPMISHAAVGQMRGLVDQAIVEGASVLVAGDLGADTAGSFFPPTVLSSPPTATILTHEIFGPVAPVVAFSDDEQVLGMANGVEHGLVAYVYTQSLDRALRFNERLEVGMIGINRGLVSEAAAPFGGVKQSGLGREGGPEGLAEYLDLTYAAIDLP